MQKPKENNEMFAKVLKNRPKPYFQEIINRDHLTPPSVLKEESCSYIGSDDVDRERYFSKKFHNLEIENIWNKVWQFACREEDIPFPGDYYIYDIVDQSILIVRTDDGTIKAYY